VEGAARAPVAVPAPHSVPGDSPFAIDVREGKPAAPAEAGIAAREQAVPEVPEPVVVTKPEPAPKKAGSLVFGRAQAPNGRRYTLRMSTPIRELRGIPDKGGFTVIMPNVLSLDRAAPIAATHKAVARSMILNKGDYAELTIRFVEGKQPAYRVKAVGQTLELVIAK